jgi:DnaJ-domain-containing protein 1
MKTKKPFSAHTYKQYDTSNGFGNRDQWRESFHARMGTEEAERIIKDQPETPHSILGVKFGATIPEIKAAFKKLIMQWHPDRNSSLEAHAMTQKIIAAYTILVQ